MFHRHLSVAVIFLGFGIELVVLMLWPNQMVYVQTARAATTTVVAAHANFTPVSTVVLPVITSDGQASSSTIYAVPFYSQFRDITAKSWQKVGCGITGLAMIVDYYGPAVPVDTLLKEGLDTHAYLDSVGWTYAGLIRVGEQYGVSGEAHDLSSLGKDAAFNALTQALTRGPVMVGVRYRFEPHNPIPHLVVVDGIVEDRVYYNDPAAAAPRGSISVDRFKLAWGGRYISFWPTIPAHV